MDKKRADRLKGKIKIIYKKRFIIFIAIIGIVIVFSGFKIGEALANKAMKKSCKKPNVQKDVIEDEKNPEDKKDEKNPDEKKIEEKIEEKAKKSKLDAKVTVDEEKNSEEKKDTDETNKKIAYLTFDDGPSRNVTPQILDILREHNVKATFFVIGSSAERNSDLIKRIYAEGHAIGNHSYSHNYEYLYSNVKNFLIDMEKNEKVLKKILGSDFEIKLVRLPGGSFGEKRALYKNAIEKEGYTSVDWNALTGDAEGQNIPKDRLVQKLKMTSKGKNEIVVLMHDLGTKQTTVNALPEIIEYLQNEGYEFRTLN